MSLMDADLEVRLRRLEIHDGDVYQLHLPSGASPETLRSYVEQIRAWLAQHGDPEVLFVCGGIERLSPDLMERAGWHRDP